VNFSVSRVLWSPSPGKDSILRISFSSPACTIFVAAAKNRFFSLSLVRLPPLRIFFCCEKPLRVFGVPCSSICTSASSQDLIFHSIPCSRAGRISCFDFRSGSSGALFRFPGRCGRRGSELLRSTAATSFFVSYGQISSFMPPKFCLLVIRSWIRAPLLFLTPLFVF
jgi:hypothetical protein